MRGRGGTRGAFKNIDIANQVKLKAWLSKYRVLIYKQAGAWATITKVGTSGQEASVCIVWRSTVTILGPIFIFPAIFHHLFCTLSHLFPTCSLTRRLDCHQITWQVTWWITWPFHSQISHAITPQHHHLTHYGLPAHCHVMMRLPAHNGAILRTASLWWTLTICDHIILWLLWPVTSPLYISARTFSS